MRAVSSSETRTRFDRAGGERDERRGGVEAVEGLDVVAASNGGVVGGDHAILELRRS